MKKAYKFFRGMALLLSCCSSAMLFSQTFNGTGGAIPDNVCTVAQEHAVVVSGVASGANISYVRLDISHAYDADVDIRLIAPNGAVIELSTDNGGSGDNYANTVFSPTATTSITAGSPPFSGIYRPEGSFATFNGQNNGTWKLRVCDDDAGISGTLNSWSIGFGTATPPATYCNSVPISNDGSGITNLTVGTSNFVIPDVTYSNQMTTTVTLQQGQTANTQITFATGYTYDTNIWIDFNNDGTFASSEQVFDGMSTDVNPTTLNASFPLSATAALGTHRMRIGTADFGQEPPNPCYSGSFGVTIDLTVNVIAPLCTSGVVSSSAISPDCANNRYFVNVNVAAVNDATAISDGTSTYPINGAGVMQVGPFVNGSSVSLSVLHSEAACNFNIGSFVYNCPPANDVCNSAIQVFCGSSVSGSTTYANGESGIPFCGTSAESGAPGVWYSLEGTGGDIALSTADSSYDTKLFVYSGSCGSLVCIDGNDDGPGTFTSQLTFATNAGQRYYIYVTGYTNFSGVHSAGTYNLTVDCICEASITDDCATVYSGYAPSSSTQLTAVGMYGLAPYTYALSDGQTNSTGVFTVSPTSTTVYEVTITDAAGCTSTAQTTVVVIDVQCSSGNGNNDAKVIVCHNGDEICISPNAVQAHLNHGDSLGSCGSATCETTPLCDARLKVPGPGATNVGTDVVLAWGAATGYVQGYYLSIGTTPGGTDVLNNFDVGDSLTYDPDLDYSTTYYVTVIAYNNNGEAIGGCQESSFTTENGPWCETAVGISCGDTVNGNTLNGSVTDYLDACGPSINEVPGVWYKFEGTGDTILASLCSAGTNFDTVLAVFAGSCSAIECYASDDDSCDGSSGSGLASEVEFVSQVGTTYYIFVTAYSANTTNPGPFTLSLTCTPPPPPSQACVDAIGISCGQSVTGSTVGYEVNDFDTCGTSINTAPGRFYKIQGNGGSMTVSTCNPGTDYDTKLAVFRGSCGNLVCVGGNDDFSGTDPACIVDEVTAFANRASKVTFNSDANQVYYIYVTGYDTEQGNYELSVSCAVSGRMADPLAWNMYPNPATRGEVQLDLSNYLNQDLGIQMMDFSGKVLSDNEVKNLQNPQYNINTGNMSSGMYFVRVVTESGVSTKKLIIAN